MEQPKYRYIIIDQSLEAYGTNDPEIMELYLDNPEEFAVIDIEEKRVIAVDGEDYPIVNLDELEDRS